MTSQIKRAFFFSWVAVLLLQPSASPASQTSRTRDAVQVIHDRIDTLTVTVTINRPGQSSGLRSLLLHTRLLRIEPPTFWTANGQPATGNAQITPEHARRMIQVLSDAKFFEHAGKYYSERTIADHSAFPPPTNAKRTEGRPLPKKAAGYRIGVVTFDEHWYTYFEDYLLASRRSGRLLADIERVLSGQAKDSMHSLRQQMKGKD